MSKIVGSARQGENVDCVKAVCPVDAAAAPLLTDLYQLNMIEAYLDHGQTKTAVFEFFVRRLPARRGFLIAAGLEQALDYLENLHFSSEEIDWLAQTGRFSNRLLDYLAGLRFTGDVHAMPEGTVFFANEPILRVTAPLPQAQLVETRLINILHFQSLIASKAARAVLAAPGKLLVDFGLRRAHGGEAGLMAARASYLAGFAGTATLLAEKLYGIPIFGTMAHSFIQAHDDETAAFEDFAQVAAQQSDAADRHLRYASGSPQSRRARASAQGARHHNPCRAARQRRPCRAVEGCARHSRSRSASPTSVSLRAAGWTKTRRRLCAPARPSTGFGLGTSLTTSSDVPALDCAYKLQEYAGVARRKRSAGKATWPGRKQVWRWYGSDGRMTGDVLSLETDSQAGEPLIQPVMQGGRRLAPGRRWPRAGRALPAISNGCLTGCARLNRRHPIRSRYRTRWRSLQPRLISRLAMQQDRSDGSKDRGRRPGCPADGGHSK